MKSRKTSSAVKPSLDSVVEALSLKINKVFRLEDYLFKEQLDFVRDPSAFKVGVTSRRAGKTVSCAADLVYTALETEDVVCLYVTLARTVAKRNIWPEIKRINRKFKLGLELNESDLSATTPNGSVIYLSGASDKTEIEKFRGLAIKKVYLDECQSFASYIQELIDEVLAPALMDYAGSLILIGTPGPVPSGYFWESAEHPVKSKGFSQHRWSFFNNPHIQIKSGRTHQEMLDRELKRSGLAIDAPKIRREWFGEWVLDRNSLVFQYDGSKCHFERLDAGDYEFILGVDVGFNDADALALIAWSPDTRNTYLLEEHITKKQGVTELAEQIRALQSKYSISKIVIDTGGLGNKISEEMSRRFGIALEPADKTRKAEYIELLNDDLRTGRFKAKRDGRFAQDCMKVEWDFDKSRPDRKVVSDRFHSDICDAALYAFRASLAYTHTATRKPPKYGSKEWADETAERLEEEALEHFLKQEELEKDPF